MNELIFVFEREDEDHEWNCTTESAAVCPGGLDSYVEIPAGTYKFEAVFTTEEPEGDNFAIKEGGEHGYTLATDEDVNLYPGASRLLARMYHAGYLFLSVRY